METSRPYLVLGLDPGIASCGFCLLDMTNHKILEMGSHLFDAPQEPKTKTSLAVTRRNARSARRNTYRTAGRMKHCLALLKEAGLVPDDADKAWLQTRKCDKPILKLRANGLDHLLTDREFAQVLYSLCGRRGYIPHGEGRQRETDDSEGKKVLSAIRANEAEMKTSHYRTVGEMLHARGKSRNHVGAYDLCVYSSQIQDEVHALFSAQRQRENPKATQRLEQDYLECLTWEKPSDEHDARAYELVGTCSYFPEEKRAANADVSSELCRAYERLGHIVIVHEDGSEQTLTTDQIDGYIRILFSPTSLKNNKDCKVTYGAIRKDLDLSGKDIFKGIATDKEKDEVFAPKSWRCLRKSLPEQLLARMLEDRTFGDDICEALTYASTEGSLRGRLEPLDLSEEERAALCANVPFTGKLFKGYGSRSRKALGILLGAFEEPEVRTLIDAEKATGLLELRLADRGGRDKFLLPYDKYDRTCRNPVVLRAMGRMRRIVNAIIRVHGVPDEIHIELGRDLKMSKREKLAVSKRQRANEAANKKWAETAAGILGCSPEEVPGRIVRKLAMREEQGEKDVYTKADIDLERLVRDDRYCEIDHILPYSRTCDDSRANKVLVLSKSNQDKRERTPYEWMTSGEPGAPNWDEFRARVIATVKYARKRANLLNTDLGPETQAQFLARNLNDDRYMSVAVKNYLEDCLLFPDDGRKRHVTAVAGGATGNLRWVWGLNFGRGNTKDRDDDRHHAVDAAIIAACSESTVKKVAEASSKGHKTFKQLRKSRLADTQPWPTFAEEVIARRAFVVPTRMVSHGVTGRVFEDFSYRLEKMRDTGYAEISRQKDWMTKERRTGTKGNYVVTAQSGIKLIDGMAFVRLWHDQSVGKTGKWYIEPVYYADIPEIHSGSYIPKYQKQKIARDSWSPVPPTAMNESPILLFSGDILVVGNHIARYRSFNIGSGKFSMNQILNDDVEANGFPPISKWTNDTQVRVLQEDCLGHCYDNLVINPEDSTFQKRQ